MDTETTKKGAAPQGAKKDLLIVRLFDAPRDRIWKAWNDPAIVKKWWGPKHFTAPVVRIDFRTGGRYLFSMRGPDGKDYWSTGVYREIVPFEWIVCTDSFANEKGNVVPATYYDMSSEFPLEMLVTVTFEEIAGSRTRMTLTHKGIPEGVMQELTAAGWSESFDKLADAVVADDRTKILAERNKPEVVVTRTYDARRAELFRAYTDRELIPQWWGPERLTTTVECLEPTAGGSWRFVQRDASGTEYAFRGVYHELRSPELIISTFEYEGMPDHVSVNTAMFEEKGGRTKVVERTVFQSVDDRDTMLREGMEEGLFESMDRLARLVTGAKTEREAA